MKALDFFLRERRAQISVELIIILAAVVALVLLLVSQLQQTSSEGTKAIEEKSKKIFEEIDKI
jgi:competence protein ComGC